ncbi:hypothetical protein ABE501_20655 [Comamonas testosteroni]
MSNITVSDSLKYANLQMASEAFLNAKENPKYGSDGNLIDALTRGNDHSSKFTDTDAIDFASHWEVVDQEPNTGTGFSGALFRNKDTNELIISFRSTEFIDDYARDNQGTNKLKIGNTGFSWGDAGYGSLVCATAASGKLPIG